ncbi:hypothetical protein BN2476_150004 [Paraburkholderia piptadeniae]|uniref:Uncharacterized protein n=1 Tax=Paraburkholderia piptadeniae TaxID=1701573 RepID=A0A1N7RS53_9BURK|nr:hypothetical protein BN2476_150004 [Paraburkholderia piptadeniae]
MKQVSVMGIPVDVVGSSAAVQPDLALHDGKYPRRVSRNVSGWLEVSMPVRRRLGDGLEAQQPQVFKCVFPSCVRDATRMYASRADRRRLHGRLTIICVGGDARDGLPT